MKKSDFYYDLPEQLIAQHPIQKRDNSRLMCLSKSDGKLEDKHFFDLLDKLQSGDTLVLNDTRVLPARIFGTKSTGAKVEFLLLKSLSDDKWECIVKPGKKAKTNDEFKFSEECSATVTDVLETGNRVVKFNYSGNNFFEILDNIGQMPLPPYIKESLSDKERYQTVYSKNLGSAAAPTAGLHFTKEMLKKLEQKGVIVKYLTLHVGLGTFRPVKAENIEDHTMHSEHYFLPSDTAEALNKAKLNASRVVAVGTTCCRTLEAVSKRFETGKLEECDGWTDIFIYPGFEFRCVDALITNFHLPESTLIMLVSALAGYENTMNAYKHAVEEKYRFFSFGDAMFIS